MSERRAATPLIAAKLAVPPARPGAVVRPRLHARLLGSSDSRLTVVVAPAGWGKTTLLSQWAQDPAETRGIVWVSLDEADDDPIRFWTYVLTALDREIPGLSAAPLGALSTPGLDPVDRALPTLLNELATLDTEHALVLDDYHLLAHRGIHESVEFLLAYLPTALQVVIAGRSDPPLPLARLRARGELTELRAVDLGFGVDEATTLLSAVGDRPYDAATAAALCERTEGWAAGLQLAALSIRNSSHPGAAAAAIRGDDRHILDYLSTEVLDRMPDEQRDLLVRTSVIERLSGPLCDELLGRSGSAAVLDALDRADLFVVPLDPQREWYRCHRLFREVLLSTLKATHPGEAARVLATAADWFLKRDYVAEAVAHRIDAGDADGAADLLRSKVPWFLERGALSTHLQLGQRLPAATCRATPYSRGAGVGRGAGGQFARMGPWLDVADPSISDDSPALEGWHSLRGAAATMRAVEDSTVRADAEAALVAADAGSRAGDRPDCAGLRGGPDDPRSDAQLRRPFRGGGPAPRRRVGPRAHTRPTAAACSPGREPPGAGPPRDRPHRRAAPAVRRRGARSPVGRGARGATPGPGISRLRTVEGRLAHRDGDLGAARSALRRAVELARAYGQASELVIALISLADVDLDDHDLAGARAALAEAREIADTEPVLPLFVRRLADIEQRTGRGPAVAARRTGVTIEDLTDRERAVLRALDRRCDPTGDRRLPVPVDQHREGLHEDPLPQAGCRHPAGCGAAGPRPRPDLTRHRGDEPASTSS